MKLDVLVIGGGMITVDQILPSLYHLQRLDRVGSISVCARRAATIRDCQADARIAGAFPGQSFTPYPDPAAAPDAREPDLYKEVLQALPPRQCVVIAVPDQFHYDVIMAALDCDQHVVCVKPLVLQYAQAVEIEQTASARGLFVGVEYHKRFDRRSLIARKDYRDGKYGEFVIGDARMIEPYCYRHSNFTNWFTVENTDPFVYVGCHYTDFVTFVTGLKPTSVSVAGVMRPFPNGVETCMWTNARVGFENGAILSVLNGLGYPDDAGGSNDQGITMFCEGDGCTGLIDHDDQFRGVAVGSVGDGKRYRYVSPDYFQYVPWEGEGAKPVGYGYDSIAALVGAAARVEAGGADPARRRDILRAIDERGLLATPANSSYNEKLHEAARESIRNGGITVRIDY